MRGFLRRHDGQLKRSCRQRPLEMHKAAKHQVELVCAHFRNIFHAEALCQIQREAVANGQLRSGFKWFENVIQAQSTVEDEEDALLEVKGNVPYVRGLDGPLMHVSANLRFALDETLLNPDSPLLTAFTLYNGVPVAQAQS